MLKQPVRLSPLRCVRADLLWTGAAGDGRLEQPGHPAKR